MANNSPPAPEATTADPRLGPERFALHPLFSAPCNDLVLLSADGVRFGFQRVFLETASEVFEGMGLLAVSNGADSSSEAMVVDEDRLPVVPLAEDAATLSLFLRFLDPREEDPQVQTYADLERCVQALVQRSDIAGTDVASAAASPWQRTSTASFLLPERLSRPTPSTSFAISRQKFLALRSSSASQPSSRRRCWRATQSATRTICRVSSTTSRGGFCGYCPRLLSCGWPRITREPTTGL